MSSEENVHLQDPTSHQLLPNLGQDHPHLILRVRLELPVLSKRRPLGMVLLGCSQHRPVTSLAPLTAYTTCPRTLLTLV